jgi:hypothetical protein
MIAAGWVTKYKGKGKLYLKLVNKAQRGFEV